MMNLVKSSSYLPTETETGEDGCNDITLMCLRAARRLPLNAPGLSLYNLCDSLC